MYSKVAVKTGYKLVIVTAHGDILETCTTGPAAGICDAYIVNSKRKTAAGAVYGIIHATDVFVGRVRIDGCLRSGKRKPISWEEAYVNFLSIFPQVYMETYKAWARANQKRLAHVLDIWENADKMLNQVSDSETCNIILRARDRAACLTSVLRAGGLGAVRSVLDQEAEAFTSQVKASLMDQRARVKAAAPLSPVDESESLTLQRCVDEGCWPASDLEDESMDEGYYVVHPSDAKAAAHAADKKAVMDAYNEAQSWAQCATQLVEQHAELRKHEVEMDWQL